MEDVLDGERDRQLVIPKGLRAPRHRFLSSSTRFFATLDILLEELAGAYTVYDKSCNGSVILSKVAVFVNASRR